MIVFDDIASLSIDVAIVNRFYDYRSFGICMFVVAFIVIDDKLYAYTTTVSLLYSLFVRYSYV